MKRIVIALYGLAVGVVLASTLFIRQPSEASAGGMPCFQCHGVNFEGSDIAPAVAGSKLTDEQITQQMRHPRGVMPAFGPADFPDPQTAITYIRAQPTGRPTMTMSPREKSAALALISGIAAARATAVLQAASQPANTTEAAPAEAKVAASGTPRPVVPETSAETTTNAPASPPATSADYPLNLVILLSALLVMGVGFAWISQRR